MGPDHVRADWHLRNWADWMRIPDIRTGYPTHSAGFSCGGISGEDAFEHLCDQADNYAAHVSHGIIQSLDARMQCAIENRYLRSVWRFRGDPEEVLAQAVQMFWLRALSKGLC